MRAMTELSSLYPKFKPYRLIFEIFNKQLITLLCNIQKSQIYKNVTYKFYNNWNTSSTFCSFLENVVKLWFYWTLPRCYIKYLSKCSDINSIRKKFKDVAIPRIRVTPLFHHWNHSDLWLHGNKWPFFEAELFEYLRNTSLEC